MTVEDITALFTRASGEYVFARWGRPIAPIVFGVEDQSLAVVKGALEAVMALSGHKLMETDPELGANLMVFFFREWDELADVPDLGRLIPELPELLVRLKKVDANQYRIFHFDKDGAIKACFVFLRMDAHLSEVPAETLALSQIVQSVLLWSDTAFTATSPLGQTDKGVVLLRPEIASLIQAAYDPIMPVASEDASHALRLFARMTLQSKN